MCVSVCVCARARVCDCDKGPSVCTGGFINSCIFAPWLREQAQAHSTPSTHRSYSGVLVQRLQPLLGRNNARGFRRDALGEYTLPRCRKLSLLRARDVWDACAALKRRDLAIVALPELEYTAQSSEPHCEFSKSYLHTRFAAAVWPRGKVPSTRTNRDSRRRRHWDRRRGPRLSEVDGTQEQSPSRARSLVGRSDQLSHERPWLPPWPSIFRGRAGVAKHDSCRRAV